MKLAALLIAASFVTAPWFQNGANVWQWVTSIVAVCGWSAVSAHYWHSRCATPFCIMPGSVPIKGTVHKACKRCATKQGHAH